MISKERLDYAAKYVRLNIDQTGLVWAAREPADFEAKDPERACIGWNRAWVGKNIHPNRNGQFSIRSEYFSVNTVVAHLGGRRMNGTYGSRIPNQGRGKSDFDKEQIKKLWEVGSHGEVVWKARRMDIVEEMRDMAAGRATTRGRSAGSFNAIGLKRFNATHAGQPAAPRPDGFVYVMGGLRARFTEICAVLRTPAVLPDRAPRRMPEPISDGLIRSLFYMDRASNLFWCAREEPVWQQMVREELAKGVPYASEIKKWNFNRADKPVKMSQENAIRVGLRSVNANRVYDVLERDADAQNIVHSTNPYSF